MRTIGIVVIVRSIGLDRASMPRNPSNDPDVFFPERGGQLEARGGYAFGFEGMRTTNGCDL
jgi:hypothetical protein